MIFVNIFNKILKSYPWIKNKDQIESVFVVSMIGSFPGLLVNALFIDIFEASKIAYVFWMLMGFTIGGLLLEHQKAFPLWTKTQKILRHPLLFIGVVCFGHLNFTL